MVRLTNRSPARNGRAGATEEVSWLVCGLSPTLVADPFDPAGSDAHAATVIIAAAAPALSVSSRRPRHNDRAGRIAPPVRRERTGPPRWAGCVCGMFMVQKLHT